jgi:hypothetical protein
MICGVAGPEETKNPAGGGPPSDSDPLGAASLEKVSLASQANSPGPQIADLISSKAFRASSHAREERFCCQELPLRVMDVVD